jgi:hypothetical protein
MEKYRKEKCKRKSIEIGIYRIERESDVIINWQGEENRFEHICVQFCTGLGARTKQPRTTAIQRRIDTPNMKY